MKTHISKRPGDWMFIVFLTITGGLSAQGIGLPWWVHLLASGALGFLFNLLHALIQERHRAEFIQFYGYDDINAADLDAAWAAAKDIADEANKDLKSVRWVP